MNTFNKKNIKLKNALHKLDVHDHLCLIYETQQEQFAAVVPFIRIGLERKEKCVYIADDNSASSVIDAMRTEGIDVETAIKSGALAVLTKKDAYLKNGYFDPDLMIQFLKDAVDSAKAEGFKALRATGEMTWALGNDIGVERLIEYEAKLNYLLPKSDILAICQYNRKRFSPEIILDIIHTHPLVVYKEMVCRNFYYVPPDEFLNHAQTSLEVERFLHNIKDREEVEEELLKLNTELEQRIKERTAELEERNIELERINSLFVGRELRMMELKEKIRELETKW
ncbi:MAG: MEDS domain-containing protein [Candidatus Schekmanbacteria bacterium]|nr:MEDS domain-containing protein [Candidatus Schekmanbacteria bacterium]